MPRQRGSSISDGTAAVSGEVTGAKPVSAVIRGELAEAGRWIAGVGSMGGVKLLTGAELFTGAGPIGDHAINNKEIADRLLIFMPTI